MGLLIAAGLAAPAAEVALEGSFYYSGAMNADPDGFGTQSCVNPPSW